MLITVLALVAGAQEFVDGAPPPIDAQHFRPTIDGRRTLWTDDATRGERGQLMLRPLFHYARRPLVYRYNDGRTVGLLNDVVQASFLAAYSYERFRIGLDVPVFLYADADGRPSQAGLGAVALDGRLVAIDRDGRVPGVAVTARLGLPTALIDLPVSDGAVTWEIAGVVEQRVGSFHFAVNAGVRGGPTVQLENTVLDDAFVFRAAGVYAPTDANGTSVELAGRVPFVGDPAAAMPVEVLVGGFNEVAPDLTARYGVGTSLTGAIGAPQLRVVLGFAWAPCGRDAASDAPPTSTGPTTAEE